MFKTLAIKPGNGFFEGEKRLLFVIYAPKCAKTLHLFNKIRLFVYLLILRLAGLRYLPLPPNQVGASYWRL